MCALGQRERERGACAESRLSVRPSDCVYACFFFLSRNTSSRETPPSWHLVPNFLTKNPIKLATQWKQENAFFCLVLNLNKVNSWISVPSKKKIHMSVWGKWRCFSYILNPRDVFWLRASALPPFLPRRSARVTKKSPWAAASDTSNRCTRISLQVAAKFHTEFRALEMPLYLFHTHRHVREWGLPPLTKSNG